MNKRAFLSALILHAEIQPAEVNLRYSHQPRKPNNPSYMRGWNAVGNAVRRRR